MPPAPEPEQILRRLVLPLSAGRLPSRVAVVGNAPVATSRQRADAIDGADLVVRMTTFAVDRDRPAVGGRTDVVVLHRALVPGPDTFRDHRRRLYLLAEPGRGWWEQEAVPPWWPGDLSLVPISNAAFTAGARKAMGLSRGAVAWPSTGTLAVHVMHRLFPGARVLLAGSSLAAGHDAGARRGRGHRFDHHWGDAVALTPEHRLGRERRALGRWAREGWLETLA